MKKCPYCAEEIQDAAIKCRHCGSILTEVAAPAESLQDSLSDVRTLLRSGQKIQAIKLVRERQGIGLSEAKDLVERLAASDASAEPTDPSLVQDNVDSVRALNVSAAPEARVPCPSCKEPVHREATVCPHCRQPILSKNAGANALGQLVLYVVLFIILYYAISAWVDYQSGREAERWRRSSVTLKGLCADRSALRWAV